MAPDQEEGPKKKGQNRQSIYPVNGGPHRTRVGYGGKKILETWQCRMEFAPDGENGRGGGRFSKEGRNTLGEKRGKQDSSSPTKTRDLGTVGIPIHVGKNYWIKS